MPARRYSTGSSTVMTLISGRLSSLSAAYRVVVLPEPVGPVTRRTPCRPLDQRQQPLARRNAEADLLERRRLLGLVEEAHHDRLALDGRQGGDANVEHRPAAAAESEMRPSCGLPALGDVELREYLHACRHADGAPPGDPLGLVEHAVDAEADQERVGLRVEVDVACAVLGRVEEYGVDEADERCVGDPVVGLEIVGIVVDHLELGVLHARAAAEGLGRAHEPGQLVGDFRARGHAQRDRMAAREAQGVDSVNVLWVGDRHAEDPLEGVGDRRDLLKHMQRYGVGREQVDADAAELYDRQPVLSGDDPRDRLARGEALVDEHLDDGHAPRLLPQDADLLLGDEPGLLQEVDDELAHQLRDRGWGGGSLRSRAPVAGQGGLSGHRSRLM